MFRPMTALALTLASATVAASNCYELRNAAGKLIYRSFTPPYSLEMPPGPDANASRARGERMTFTNADVCPPAKPSGKDAPTTRHEGKATPEQQFPPAPPSNMKPLTREESVALVKKETAWVSTVTQEEIDKCLDWIGVIRNYKDKESMRLDLTPTAMVDLSGEKRISLYINARNSYGAYAGASFETCYLKLDGTIDYDAFGR